MTMKRLKIRCPKCSTVYSIDQMQMRTIGKRAARCLICESRFFIENREEINRSNTSQSDVEFLQSYFEKRSDIPRRMLTDRRKDVVKEIPSLNEFPHDIIPIFSSQGNGIIGHISPGRRQGADRRSGIERRSCLTALHNTGGEMLPEYRFNESRAILHDN
jgi:predicted Zn finger-like uncharacterized protein